MIFLNIFVDHLNLKSPKYAVPKLIPRARIPVRSPIKNIINDLMNLVFFTVL